MFSGSKHMVAAFDLLCCLLLVFVMRSSTTPKPPQIPTYGALAVTIQWADGSNNDVDLYVRDPHGDIAYFAAQDIGLMHLENDDLGTNTSGVEGTVVTKRNGERTVLRGTLTGEYTVNVQMYHRADDGETPVHVELWSLHGMDKLLYSRTVVLGRTGDEKTAFRFVVSAAGNVVRFNRIPANLAEATNP